MQRATGYLEMMTLDDDENTATFLIEKLEKLLEPLPEDSNDTVFADALADDFEIIISHGSIRFRILEFSKRKFR